MEVYRKSTVCILLGPRRTALDEVHCSKERLVGTADKCGIVLDELRCTCFGVAAFQDDFGLSMQFLDKVCKYKNTIILGFHVIKLPV